MSFYPPPSHPTPSPPPNDLEKKFFEQKWIKYLEILSFYTYMCTISEDHDIWFLKYKVRQTEIFVILGHFLTFQPSDNLESQNFRIEKSSWRYYHFTHLNININDNYMMYGYRNMEHNRAFFWFWTIFCPFTNLKTWKIKIFKKWKNCLEISFNTFATEMTIIWCMVPEIWSVTEFFVIFDCFFALSPT